LRGAAGARRSQTFAAELQPPNSLHSATALCLALAEGNVAAHALRMRASTSSLPLV